MPYNQYYEIEHLTMFDFLSDEYRTLYDNSSATVFQHPVWLDLMYKNLAPSCGVEPAIITIRSSDTGRLCLVLPLVKSKYANLKCIEPMDLGVCDYNAVVACDDLGERFYDDETLRKAIVDKLRPADLIFFRKLRETQPEISHSFGEGNAGLMGNNAYDVALSSPYEDWREQVLSSKFRKAMRRTKRKLEELGKVELHVLTSEADILNAMETMRAQRALRYADDLFQQDIFFDFYCRVAVEGAKSGFTETSILKVGDDIAAVEFGLLHDQCYHFILCGIDGGKYAKHSPGMLMKDLVLAERVAKGDVRADFTIGDEDYKTRYGAKPKPLTYFARPESIMGTIAVTAYQRGGVIKAFAKKAAAFSKRRAA